MNRGQPIIAIDGPVGAGKSTVARELAAVLKFTYVNTGAMYRALAVAVRDANILSNDPDLESKIIPILKSAAISFAGLRVILNGRDISAQITEPEVSDLASRYSTLKPVRERMQQLQRELGMAGGVVMEGRDIGTAVFPDAEFKFYLDADPRVRAERRYDELVSKGLGADREEVLNQLMERDTRDRARQLAPLRCADDAIVIDTTHLPIAQVVGTLKQRIEQDCARERA